VAILILPTNSDTAFYNYNIDLENINYFFEFQWNGRFGRWLLTISDVDQVPLMAGIPLEPGLDLLGLMTSADLPPGLLMLMPADGVDTVCGRDDLGENFYLAYVES